MQTLSNHLLEDLYQVVLDHYVYKILLVIQSIGLLVRDHLVFSQYLQYLVQPNAMTDMNQCLAGVTSSVRMADQQLTQLIIALLMVVL